MTRRIRSRKRLALIGFAVFAALSFAFAVRHDATLHLPGLPIYLAGVCFLVAFTLAWGFAHPHQREPSPEPTTA